MAKFLFLCFLLANTLLGQEAMATNKPQINVQSISAPSPNPLAQSPSSDQRTNNLEPFIGRKLGKHQHKSETPSPSPFEAPQSENTHSSSEGSIPSHQRTSVEPHDEEVLDSHQGQVHLVKQHHHHSHDKSVAGGGVILGGLATTFLVSVYCYIKATGRNKLETTA